MHLFEHLRVRLPLLGFPVGSRLLHSRQLILDAGICRRKLARLLKELGSILLVLLVFGDNSLPEECLGLLDVRDTLDRQCVVGRASRVVELLKLVLEQGGVCVKADAQLLELRTKLCWVALDGGRVFLQVAQTLLVLAQSELEVAALECLVAHALQLVGDLGNVNALPLLTLLQLVVGEVLVSVSGCVGLLPGELFERHTGGHFTAVCDGTLPCGLVLVSNGCVLHLPDNALAANNLAEDHVLAVQVGCGHGGDEELAAVGARAGIGHAEEERLLVLELKVLVLEFLAVDALTAGAVALCEVTVIAISFAPFMSSRPLFLTLPVS